MQESKFFFVQTIRLLLSGTTVAVAVAVVIDSILALSGDSVTFFCANSF